MGDREGQRECFKEIDNVLFLELNSGLMDVDFVITVKSYVYIIYTLECVIYFM